MGELYFGKMFGFMEKDEDHGNYLHALDVLLAPLLTASVLPTYLRTIWLGSGLILPSARKALSCFEDIKSAAKKGVAERRNDLAAGKATRNDLLTKLFEIQMSPKRLEDDFQISDIEQEAYAALFVLLHISATQPTNTYTALLAATRLQLQCVPYSIIS